MYMVDKDEVVNSEFGFTNKDGDIEKIYYDENDNNVVIDQEGYDYRIYPQDVANMIKALQYMQKYLIDKGVIKE